MNVKIRREKKDDFKEVSEINTLAFGQKNEAILVDHLRNSDAFVPELSMVATIDSYIVGHILFTKIKIIDSNQNEFNSLALAPMAVRPAFQKNGIGGQLIRTGLDEAREMDFESVVVLGHEHYYPKFGFVPADKWKIKAPFDVPSNVLWDLNLLLTDLKTYVEQ